MSCPDFRGSRAHLLGLLSGTERSDEPPCPSYFADLITAAHVVRLSWPLGAHLLPSARLQVLLDTHAAPLAALVRRQTAEPRPRRTGARAAPADSTQCAALWSGRGHRAPAGSRRLTPARGHSRRV
ncbi:hypothetical protein [Kitasatospora sp. NPDC097691]|uniref:hypothetical protein n=1 Tax=Kitasatospora sp. NPDC097691 TaxID=3157231 RepID=UPI00331E04EE